MIDNPQTNQTSTKLTSGVVDAAGELVSAAIELVPDGSVDAAVQIGGTILNGAVEVGKSVIEGAGDILGDAL